MVSRALIAIAVCLGADVWRPTVGLAKAPGIPPRQVFSTVQRIALEGCRFPRDIELDDSVAAVADSIGWQLDSLLIKALEDSGLDPISARDWRPAWERMVDPLGGVYDAATGEPDSAGWLLAERRARAIVQTAHPTDAWLLPRVVRRPAYFDPGPTGNIFATPGLKWDGTFRGAHPRISGLDISGDEAVAYSLSVQVVDLRGNVLYQGIGGLDIDPELSRLNFKLQPSARVLWSRDRSQVAVDRALAILAANAPHPRRAPWKMR